MREFESGALRDDDDGKYDYEGFLSPLVLQDFAAYMHGHRKMADGTMRSSDNWQKGFPEEELLKSLLLRHIFDIWLIHRTGLSVRPEDGELVEYVDALGGAFFNLQALWLAYLRRN